MTKENYLIKNYLKIKKTLNRENGPLHHRHESL